MWIYREPPCLSCQVAFVRERSCASRQEDLCAGEGVASVMIGSPEPYLGVACLQHLTLL